jgi:hypothetical protein
MIKINFSPMRALEGREIASVAAEDRERPPGERVEPVTGDCRQRAGDQNPEGGEEVYRG